ncbi:MAG: diguanylate cyclase [Paracoccaceae bacterium]
MQGRILIVDDVATNRIIYKVKLGEAFYEPLLAADGQSCLALARAERPDLILLDLDLPDMDGTEVLRELRTDLATRAIPVIVLTASTSSEARIAALSAGADEVMSKPVPDQELMARVRNLLRSRGEAGFVSTAWGMSAHSVLGLSEQPGSFDRLGKVALVTTTPQGALRQKRDLQGCLRDTMVAMTRETALAVSAPDGGGTDGGAVPDVFLIEADLDGSGGGLRLMSELKSRAATRHSAFCIASAPAASPGSGQNGNRADGRAIAFDLGADDVVDPAMGARELALRLRILIRRKRQGDLTRTTLQDGLRLAVIDPLTGVYNRRYAMPRLAGISAQAVQEGSEFAVMVVDLDRFKEVNDRHGHAAGDRVLSEMARRLTDNLRMTDLLARIGGEEFLVALPQTSYPDAQRVADRLCRVIGDHPVRLGNGQMLRVTASIGVVMGPAQGQRAEDIAALVDQADRALLTSKASGRNQVTFGRTAA